MVFKNVQFETEGPNPRRTECDFFSGRQIFLLGHVRNVPTTRGVDKQQCRSRSRDISPRGVRILQSYNYRYNVIRKKIYLTRGPFSASWRIARDVFTAKRLEPFPREFREYNLHRNLGILERFSVNLTNIAPKTEPESSRRRSVKTLFEPCLHY